MTEIVVPMKLREQLRQNTRDLMTLPPYLRPGITWEQADDDDIQWLVDHFTKQAAKAQNLLDRRRGRCP